MNKLIEKCRLTDEEYSQAIKDAEQEWMWNRSGKNLGRARAEYRAEFTALITKAIPIIRAEILKEIEEYDGSYIDDRFWKSKFWKSLKDNK